MCWFLILGYLMGWFEPPKQDTQLDTLEPKQDTSVDIPEMYRADPAVREAEKLVRCRR